MISANIRDDSSLDLCAEPALLGLMRYIMFSMMSLLVGKYPFGKSAFSVYVTSPSCFCTEERVRFWKDSIITAYRDHGQKPSFPVTIPAF